jgi:hypothetical protein
MNAKQFFVDVMSKEQKLKLKGLIALWLVALFWFWNWWFRQDHFVTLWGMVINSIMIGWTIFLPGYYFFFLYRMKIANPELNPPKGSYAIVVTKAPSEPWPVSGQDTHRDVGTKVSLQVRCLVGNRNHGTKRFCRGVVTTMFAFPAGMGLRVIRTRFSQEVPLQRREPVLLL